MKRIPTPLLWLAIALIGMALAAGSFIVVAWLKLQPCPLCIAQRTLFMLMGGVALVAFFTHRNLAGRESAGVTKAPGSSLALTHGQEAFQGV